jgi:Asp-tRNA(Asn)/Glu-tRNA(Gln) amidotransferase A subunit family amidase
MHALNQVAARLEAIEPSRALIDRCLERIRDPEGEGARTFLKVYGEAARATADAIDQLRLKGAAPSQFAGIPVSIEDLFDVAGDVTTAGSIAPRGRIHTHRPHQHDRVRLFGPRHQPALRYAAQSL